MSQPLINVAKSSAVILMINVAQYFLPLNVAIIPLNVSMGVIWENSNLPVGYYILKRWVNTDEYFVTE